MIVKQYCYIRTDYFGYFAKENIPLRLVLGAAKEIMHGCFIFQTTQANWGFTIEITSISMISKVRTEL